VLAIAGLLAIIGPAHAELAPADAECERLRQAINADQRVISAARRTLSPAEAKCALDDFALPVSGDCERLMDAAKADEKKRRAWADVLVAWSSLDRHMLAMRSLEERTGVNCLSR
jgi:hypothetical protein